MACQGQSPGHCLLGGRGPPLRGAGPLRACEGQRRDSPHPDRQPGSPLPLNVDRGPPELAIGRWKGVIETSEQVGSHVSEQRRYRTEG